MVTECACHRGWRRRAGNEFCERLAYYGYASSASHRVSDGQCMRTPPLGRHPEAYSAGWLTAVVRVEGAFPVFVEWAHTRVPPRECPLDKPHIS
jgi:hypothetical protein